MGVLGRRTRGDSLCKARSPNSYARPNADTAKMRMRVATSATPPTPQYTYMPLNVLDFARLWELGAPVGRPGTSYAWRFTLQSTVSQLLRTPERRHSENAHACSYLSYPTNPSVYLHATQRARFCASLGVRGPRWASWDVVRVAIHSAPPGLPTPRHARNSALRKCAPLLSPKKKLSLFFFSEICTNNSNCVHPPKGYR